MHYALFNYFYVFWYMYVWYIMCILYWFYYWIGFGPCQEWIFGKEYIVLFGWVFMLVKKGLSCVLLCLIMPAGCCYYFLDMLFQCICMDFNQMLYYNAFILLCAINSYLHIEHFHIYDVFFLCVSFYYLIFISHLFCFEFYFYFVRALYLNFNLSWPGLSLPGHIFYFMIMVFLLSEFFACSFNTLCCYRN